MKRFITLLFILILVTPAVYSQTTAGDNLFNNNTTHSIYITFSQANYILLLKTNKVSDDNNGTSTYLAVTAVVDGITLDSVGIQFKGNSSYYNYSTDKKPITLSFNQYRPLQLYDSISGINLNNFYQDPTCMREKLFLDFASSQGIYAPRANYARVYLNGTYWGLYLMVERINKTFLKDRFNGNGGNLFKGDGATAGCANLFHNSTVSNYFSCYELKTNTKTNDWTDLQNLTKQINNTTNTAFYDSLEVVMNTNSFIGAWAAYNLFVEFDSYPYRFVHNYYIYHNKKTKKFDWIIWDASTAFGMDVPGTVAQIEATSVLYIASPATDRPLAKRMLENSIYKDTYLKKICSFATNDFLPSILNPKIDAIYNQIKSDVYAETKRMYSNTDFETNINTNNGNTPGLKSFITNRSKAVLAELNSLGYAACPSIVSSIKEGTVESSKISIFPNPVLSLFSIQTYSSEKIEHLVVYDLLGNRVFEKKINHAEEANNIDLSKLRSGQYFVQVRTNIGLVNRKFIKE